ncbi:MAG: hypothetical protein HWN68_16670 [Desulfobacterales bacterium]|nr:hypothetical protein [Desulfobacterales bacterium]
MKKLFFCSTPCSLLLKICLIIFVILLSGCTLHFKGKDIELDAERQRVQNNRTFKLDHVDLL